jgi:hypothetical protein
MMTRQDFVPERRGVHPSKSGSGPVPWVG